MDLDCFGGKATRTSRGDISIKKGDGSKCIVALFYAVPDHMRQRSEYGQKTLALKGSCVYFFSGKFNLCEAVDKAQCVESLEKLA